MQDQSNFALRADFSAEMPPGCRHHSRQVGNARREHLEVHAEEGCQDRSQVLDSAIANAYNNFNADVDDLKVTRIEVDPAPSLKALSCARQRARRADSQAQQPHPRSSFRRQARRLMGQKVNPIGIVSASPATGRRVVCAFEETSPRISTRLPGAQVSEQEAGRCSVSNIHIERAARRANITIHTARPGIVIGKKGEDIEKLRTAVAKILGMGMNDVRLNIAEIRKPELDANWLRKESPSSWRASDVPARHERALPTPCVPEHWASRCAFPAA